jgi:hypothetical protein
VTATGGVPAAHPLARVLPIFRDLLGAIDVTGGDHLASPHSLALVRATALAAARQISPPSMPCVPPSRPDAALREQDVPQLIS